MIIFLHWVFTLPGVSNLTIEADELHVWHMGCLQYFIGSILFILTFDLGGGDPESNWDNIWGAITEFYATRNTSTQDKSLSISSFAKEKPRAGFPCLKGRGAEAKDLLPAIAAIWADMGKSHKHYEKSLACWMVWRRCKEFCRSTPQIYLSRSPSASASNELLTSSCWTTNVSLTMQRKINNSSGTVQQHFTGCGIGVGKSNSSTAAARIATSMKISSEQ